MIIGTTTMFQNICTHLGLNVIVSEVGTCDTIPLAGDIVNTSIGCAKKRSVPVGKKQNKIA